MTTTAPTGQHEPPIHRPASPARARAVAFAGVLLAVGLAACTTGSGAAGASAAASPTAVPSAAVSGPSGSPLAPGASPTASSVNAAADASGDATPGYLDIARLRVEAESNQLTLALDLAAAVPPGSPGVGQLAYVFSLDSNGDGVPEYTATLQLVPEGGFRPILVDLRSGAKLEGAAYPGTANLAGQSVMLTLPLDSIGCPPALAVRGASERTKGGVKTGDTVPDAAADWISISTSCPTPS